MEQAVERKKFVEPTYPGYIVSFWMFLVLRPLFMSTCSACFTWFASDASDASRNVASIASGQLAQLCKATTPHVRVSRHKRDATPGSHAL